jgi:hypothetical protein
MNLVARGDQTRHQLFSNRAGRTCHKHSHHWLLDRKIIYSNDKTAASGVTPIPMRRVSELEARQQRGSDETRRR